MSRETIPPITFKGETRSVPEWAAVLNLSPETIYTRLRRGFPVEKVLAQVVKPPSRNEGEIYLDDLERGQLPKVIAKVVNNHHSQKQVFRYGKFMRREYPSVFEAWFQKEFLPQQA